MTSRQRLVEIFSAGTHIDDKAIELVNELACPSCDVRVLDVQDSEVTQRAEELGIRSVPAIVIDGTLAECCAGRVPDADALRAVEIGQPL